MKVNCSSVSMIASVLFVFPASAGEAWTIESQSDWEENSGTSENLELKDGKATPTAKEATFSSKLKVFPESRSAKSLTIAQSPEWLNWNPIDNIGPSNLADAPVLLRRGAKDYWMFGRYGGKKPKRAEGFKAEKATLEGFDIPLMTTPYANQFNAPGGLNKSLGGYHAWQSRDMLNWVHHGPITESFSRWMTTAEFVDGKAYFYYDFPNDQDPHVYVDEDLTDGKPGKNMGMALKDPSHGSDSAVIRDLDGNFHIIFEDWSPISANKRAWDSPLAGRAVSSDGTKGFEIVEEPPVDNRTKPTGKIGTYRHPHWAKEDPKNYKTNVAEYEIHEPEQEAYGDWAAIAIGGQYYLFGDYDPAGGHQMSVGWFTSPGIGEPFEWCGNIGKGHPDPDVIFAEGKFYLATQQKSDFTSPGPWVESVSARVGVDTNKDGKADQWSEWQNVKEAYKEVPGFSKQVERVPASLDLEGLPDGFGFQIEIKVQDTTENRSKPVLDQLMLSFD
ncbi:hypothetical protein [Haloferula sp.]|uniref:hypothetical protein n=1 Tax=Haloferula sp. TaxID=2497595 RepID=UPI00329DEFF2